MTSIIISGYYGFYNTGDEAILEAIINSLKGKIIDLELTVFSGDPKNIIESYKINSIYQYSSWFTKLRCIRKSDVFILGGGGLIEEWYGWRQILFYLEEVLLAKLMGKKIMIYAQGFGPLFTPMGKILASILSNLVDLITVRDENSEKMLRLLGVIRPKIYVTADPAISLNPIDKQEIDDILYAEKISDKDFLIGINLRQWRYLTNIDVKKIAQLADFLITKMNAVLVFIPFKFGNNKDVEIIQKVIKEMKYTKKTRIIQGHYKPRELMGLIGRMKFFLGMRLHSLMFASIMGVPTVGINYDPKILNYFQSINHEKWVINLNSIDPYRVIELIRQRLAADKNMKRELLSRIHVLKTKESENTKLLLQLIK